MIFVKVICNNEHVIKMWVQDPTQTSPYTIMGFRSTDWIVQYFKPRSTSDKFIL